MFGEFFLFNKLQVIISKPPVNPSPLALHCHPAARRQPHRRAPHVSGCLCRRCVQPSLFASKPSLLFTCALQRALSAAMTDTTLTVAGVFWVMVCAISTAAYLLLM